MSTIYFDLESAPLDEAYLLETFAPKFEANKTLKDPIKIAIDLAQKKQDWLEQSALHAERARVLAIGWKDEAGGIEIIEGDEEDILNEFLDLISDNPRATLAGFNILGYDLPFVRRRCIILGISFRHYNRADEWKPWALPIYDAMQDWCSGNFRDTISLDNLARGLGLGGKNGSGKDFSALYANDREAALSYLRRDVELTAQVCERMRA